MVLITLDSLRTALIMAAVYCTTKMAILLNKEDGIMETLKVLANEKSSCFSVLVFKMEENLTQILFCQRRMEIWSIGWLGGGRK